MSWLDDIAAKFTPTTMEQRMSMTPVSFTVPLAISSGAAGIWNGLSTTAKVGIGAAAGGAAVYGYDWLFGGSKKDQLVTPTLTQNPAQAIAAQPKTISNVTTYYNQTDNSSIFNSISGSPGAYIQSKKDMSMNPSLIPSINVPFSITPAMTTNASQPTTTTAGTDLTTIAIIAAIGLVAYGAVKK
jgi:hypothetical protein